MALYALADTHFSFGVNKPMDIFNGWENYQERIKQNWQNTVSAADTVIINGDFSWGMNLKQAKADFAFCESLPGKKIISKGNHDYWWNTVKKINEFLEASGFGSISILNNDAISVDGFSVCASKGYMIGESQHDKKLLARECQRLSLSLEKGLCLGGEIVAFLHYPPITKDFIVSDLISVLKKYGVKKCFYGHLHGKSHKRAFTGEYDGIFYDLVSADYLNFIPKIIK